MARLMVELSDDEVFEIKDISATSKATGSRGGVAEGVKRVISESSKNTLSKNEGGGMRRKKATFVSTRRAKQDARAREEEEVPAPKPKSRALHRGKETTIVPTVVESTSISMDEDVSLAIRPKQCRTESRNPSSMSKPAAKAVDEGEDEDIEITAPKAKPRKKTGTTPEDMENDEEIEDLSSKPKPRKRILKQATENPLLRPFTSTTSAKSSRFSDRKESTKVAVVEETEIVVKPRSRKAVLPEPPRVKEGKVKVVVPETEEELLPRPGKTKQRAKSVEDSESEAEIVNNKRKGLISKHRRAPPLKAWQLTMRAKPIENSEFGSGETTVCKEKDATAKPRTTSPPEAKVVKEEADAAEESEMRSFVTAMSEEEIILEESKGAPSKARKLRENLKIEEDSEDGETKNLEGNEELPQPGRSSSPNEETRQEQSKVREYSKRKSLPSIVTEKKRTVSKPNKSSASSARQPPSYSRHAIDESETEEDDLSDFIVDDDSSCFIVEDDVESEDEIVKTPPKSVRRLVRGRRPGREDTDDDDLEEKLGKFNLKDEEMDDNQAVVKKIDFGGGKGKDKSDKAFSRRGSEEIESNKPRTKMDLPPKKKSQSPTSDLDDPFSTRFSPQETKSKRDPIPNKRQPPPPSSDLDEPFTLRYSPPQYQPKTIPKETLLTTPPSSPELKPPKMISPAKRPQIDIPASPHKQSSDAFWSQDVVNDWNDEYSPQKIILPSRPKLISTSPGTLLFSPTKRSLAKIDKAARDAKKAFSDRKHALAESFLHELDEKITQGRVAQLASSTGGIKIIWSKKLNTTAGRAKWKRETLKSSNPLPVYRHHAAIELAEKVIDDEDRLLNVIAHEFCHLANFMISNIKTNPHGKEFKAWASRVSREFAERGIEVTTKHSYVIDYKYVWNCTSCSLEYKRHSKSIDPVRHRCGTCKSTLVQIKPVPRKGTADGKVVTGYQAFVKEHMKKVREENPGSPQKEIMGLVGKRYQEFKKILIEKEEESG